MAELVDALVSNTNAARRAGSIPALGTENSPLSKRLKGDSCFQKITQNSARTTTNHQLSYYLPKAAFVETDTTDVLAMHRFYLRYSSPL